MTAEQICLTAGDSPLTRQPLIRVGWLAMRRHLDVRFRLLRPFGFYRRFALLPPSTRMRAGNISDWLNANASGIRCELYDPAETYDAVVVVKFADPDIVEIARRLKKQGTKVVYDVNVNYWEVWGEYTLASPKPTAVQQASAHRLTELADLVVADSTYLASVARKHAPLVRFIPDNVDLTTYNHVRAHRAGARLRLVWSGMSHKAPHLELILPAIHALRDQLELVVASERAPQIMNSLPAQLPTKFVRFSDRRYAKTLARCDVIISPKRLLNAYDLGHTEYKITLGMAAGLPAIASPQQSYIEAISYKQGGLIAESLDDWVEGLRRMQADVELRAEMGRRARLTVVEKYSTPIVAQQYASAIRDMFIE